MAPPEGKHKVPGHGKGHGHKKDPEKGEKHDQAKLKLEEEHKVKIKPGDKDELGHVTQRLATILRGLTDGDGSALNQLAESLRGHDADVDLNVETDGDGNTTKAVLTVIKRSSNAGQTGSTEADDQGFDFAIPARRPFPYTDE